MPTIIEVTKTVKMAQIVDLMGPLFANRQGVRLTVTGGSMYPFLRAGVDSVLLAGIGGQALKKGDIVLYKRDNGQHVLHRIVKKTKAGFFMAGDAQTMVEGPVDWQCILAVVTRVYRGSRSIPARQWGLLIAAGLWHTLRPFSCWMIGCYRFVRRHCGHQHPGKL